LKKLTVLNDYKLGIFIIALVAGLIMVLSYLSIVTKDDCPTYRDTDGYCVFGTGWGN